MYCAFTQHVCQLASAHVRRRCTELGLGSGRPLERPPSVSVLRTLILLLVLVGLSIPQSFVGSAAAEHSCSHERNLTGDAATPSREQRGHAHDERDRHNRQTVDVSLTQDPGGHHAMGTHPAGDRDGHVSPGSSASDLRDIDAASSSHGDHGCGQGAGCDMSACCPAVGTLVAGLPVRDLPRGFGRAIPAPGPRPSAAPTPERPPRTT